MPNDFDSETAPGDQLPHGWEMRGFCNEEMQCKCFAPKEEECENDECTGNGGKCILPDEEAPEGWEMRGFCNKEMQCKCYAPNAEECKNNQCTNVKKGICVMPDETPPANHLVNGYCNQQMGCKCYVPQSDPEPTDCKNEKCGKNLWSMCPERTNCCY